MASVDKKERRVLQEGGCMGAIYGFACLGALVYYIQHAVTLGAGALGILKAIFWPGVVMYRVLELLKL